MDDGFICLKKKQYLCIEIKKDIVMAKLSTAAKKRIIQWIDNLEDGDTIKLKGGVAYIYNESGCELDNTLS